MNITNRIRRPDLIVCPDLPVEVEDPAMPRFLAEIQIHNQSEPEADTWCRSYFQLIPQLQSALLIKIYPRRVDGFSGLSQFCIGVKSFENPDSEKVIVETAVSFGSKELLKRNAR
jgi:hypothetical protein